MILWFFLFGSVLSAPTDEFGEFARNDGVLSNQDQLLRNIVPSGLIPHKIRQGKYNDIHQEVPHLKNLDPNNKYLRLFNTYLRKGVTMKGLTFSIYNDNMREAAVTLFRLFQITEGEDFRTLKEWAQQNINNEMFMYALRLESLHTSKSKEDRLMILPPYIWNPNYFVNSETIHKALLVADDVRTFGKRIDPQISTVDQYDYNFYTDDVYVAINSNYSGWNLPTKGIDDEINYFREDVALNSYYLGIHLLHPFWMSNDELDSINPRHAEHYYYAHQQLMARYLLEKLHLKNRTVVGRDESDYVPYLTYKNGLPFPTRSSIKRDWDTEHARLKTIDIALKECISRGIIYMENGTTINMTNDNHIDILARLIRANLDSNKTSKIVRNIFGYGGNKFPVDEYNPAPSLLHHPETSLRDPIYWHLIQYMLNYFSEYKNAMEPFDISDYENDDIIIVDASFTKIMSYFDYFAFSINNAISYSTRNMNEWPAFILARQKRLQHTRFTLNFTVESLNPIDSIVRLYLGPQCGDNCWKEYSKFYELDTFKFRLETGINVISWSPETSEKYSFDYFYETLLKPDPNKFNMYKFPGNLLFPKGLEEGLNLTLFIMITPTDEDSLPLPPSYYREIVSELDSNPLGFPFHREATGFDANAFNYRFYNITIYHKKLPVDNKGFFSPNLY